METNREDHWVSNQLAILEPQWNPDLARGRELLDARLGERRRSWAWTAAAATVAAVCVAMIALPGTRALAQELWYRIVLNRVDVVRLDLSTLPLQLRVTSNGLERRVLDIDEAARNAGFRPYLPPPDILDATPGITVSGPITLEQTIHVRDLESALSRVGDSDLQVPADWEGVQLRSEIGPTVAANYQDNVRIVQTRPIQLSVPPGFALERFAEAAFRSVGASRWEARALAQKFAAHPAWLVDLPQDALTNVQEVALRTGPALLIEDLDKKGGVKRATLVWSTSQRMYSVSSSNRELSTKIANALP